MNESRKLMTDQQLEEAIVVGPKRQIKLSVATLISVVLAIVGGVASYNGLANKADENTKEIAKAAAAQEKYNEEQKKFNEEFRKQLAEVDRRVFILEMQPRLGNVHNTGQGGHVNMSLPDERKELEGKPELKTSEMAKLLGVTSETITNNIKRDSTGEPIHFEYLGKQYPVRRSGNTFVIENPFFEK